MLEKKCVILFFFHNYSVEFPKNCLLMQKNCFYSLNVLFKGEFLFLRQQHAKTYLGKYPNSWSDSS